MNGDSNDNEGKPDPDPAWYRPFDGVDAYGVGVMPAGLFGGTWEDRKSNHDALFNAAAANSMPPSPHGVSMDAMLATMRNDPDGGAQASSPSVLPLAGVADPATAAQPSGVTLSASAPFLGDDRQALGSGQNRTAWYQPFATTAAGPNSQAGTPQGDNGVGDHPVAAPDAANGQQTSGINWSMVAGNEGNNSSPYTLEGKVPNKDFQHSGVTIANGVDLSKHTAADLKRWGVSDEAIAKLAPFLKPDLKSAGPTGMNAVTALNSAFPDPKKPFSLGDADSNAMVAGARNDTVSYVRKAYDAAGPSVKFDQLPERYRTAIIDVAYQHGASLASTTPKFWHDVVTGDWNTATNELNHFGDHFPSRRESDAYYMQHGVQRPGAGK
jgi:hypothetical protein